MELDTTETNEALEDLFINLVENPVVQLWIGCNLVFCAIEMVKAILYVPTSNDE